MGQDELLTCFAIAFELDGHESNQIAKEQRYLLHCAPAAYQKHLRRHAPDILVVYNVRLHCYIFLNFRINAFQV
jgi:hypothetical protein